MRSPFASAPDSTLINIGNIVMSIQANEPWGDIDPAMYGTVIYPRGTSRVVYKDGFLWGGIVRDQAEPSIRVGGETYEAGTIPGRIISRGVSEIPTAPNVNRVWRVRRDYRDADLRQDAAEIFGIPIEQIGDRELQAVRAQYEADWKEWPWEKGAPFYDRNANGVYDLYVDEPGFANADQVVWLVRNDLSFAATTGLYGSPPIGLEMQLTLWAYKSPEALRNVIFKQCRIIYKGDQSTPDHAKIDSMYIGQWSDPDIGNNYDDLVGCDPPLNLGFAYNALTSDTAFDKFNLPPPALGYKILAGPLVSASGHKGILGLRDRVGFRNLLMTAFTFVSSGADNEPDRTVYAGTLHWWNLFRGFQPRPTSPPNPKIDPTTGQPSRFWVNGDPVSRTGWLNDYPDDYRMLAVSGPFTMALGDTNEMTVALVGGLGADRLFSFSVMKYNAKVAQEAFDKLFALPTPPPTPALVATELDKQIVLTWGHSPTQVEPIEKWQKNGHQFEGYNLYQLPYANANFKSGIKLATYDLQNEVTTILQDEFDSQTGAIITVPVQAGKNSGLVRSQLIDRDRIDNRPLINGREYCFAVTAYSYNPDRNAAVRSLESAPAIIAVTPHSLNPGVILNATIADTIPVLHSKGNSDGKVIPTVIDPTKLTSDEYKVTFGEAAPAQTVWNLLNVTKGTTVLSEMTNQSGDNNYLITDGLQVIVTGPPPGVKQDDQFSNPDHPEAWGWAIPSGQRRWTWLGGDGLHLEGFRGAIGWGGSYLFNVSTLRLDQIYDILIKFAATDVNGDPLDSTDPDISYAYRYLNNASLPAAKPEFAPFIVNPTGDFSFQDFKKSVPWAAYVYNKTTKVIGKRLSIGFLENNVAGGLVDGKWWPPIGTSGGNNTAQTGPREWFWIFDIEYSESPNPLLGSPTSTMFSGAAKPIVIWGTVARRAPVGNNAEDELAIFVNHPNGPEDEFEFQPPAPTFDPAKAREDVLRQVNVFPNPFYGIFQEDASSASRYVTFSHLPKKAVIRIFTLAGTLVKTMIKDDESQFIRWNLLNENGRLVGSGLYIAHIEMPELDVSKNLKLAVVHK